LSVSSSMEISLHPLITARPMMLVYQQSSVHTGPTGHAEVFAKLLMKFQFFNTWAIDTKGFLPSSRQKLKWQSFLREVHHVGVL
jgi:hypothetical protein